MKIRKLIELGIVLLFLLGLLGCNSGKLFFTTYTKFGLDVSVTNLKPTQAMFGFKRFEGAIIPVEVKKAEKEGANGGAESASDEEPEAMSVFAAIEVKNSWIKGLKIRQVFATGPAADNCVRYGEELANILIAGRKDEKNQGDGQ